MIVVSCPVCTIWCCVCVWVGGCVITDTNSHTQQHRWSSALWLLSFALFVQPGIYAGAAKSGEILPFLRFSLFLKGKKSQFSFALFGEPGIVAGAANNAKIPPFFVWIKTPRYHLPSLYKLVLLRCFQKTARFPFFFIDFYVLKTLPFFADPLQFFFKHGKSFFPFIWPSCVCVFIYVCASCVRACVACERDESFWFILVQ